MNKHFNQIEDSDWMTKQDRDDFARYCYIYSKHIGQMYGHFDWHNEEFVHFCTTNQIAQKGNKKGENKENHFWFNSLTPKEFKTNDIAHHFLRHIRNAVAHGLIEISHRGKHRQKYYIVKDFDIHGTQSMGGLIRSDLLWGMLWLLYQTKR